MVKACPPLVCLPQVSKLSEARSDQGGGVLGVIDGQPPLAVEIEEDIENRIELLKRIGYKR